MADEDIDTIENIFAKDMDRLLAARDEIDSVPPEEPESVADAFEIATTEPVDLPPGPPASPPMEAQPPGPPAADPLLTPPGPPASPSNQPAFAPPAGAFGAPPGPPPMDATPPGPPAAPPMDAAPPGPPAAPPMDAAPPGPPSGPPAAPVDLSALASDMFSEEEIPSPPSPPPVIESYTDHFEPPQPIAPPEPTFDKVDISSWDSNWNEDWSEKAEVFSKEDSAYVPEAVQDDVEWDAESESIPVTKNEVALPSQAAMKRMKKAELVELANDHGVDASGTKADIISRLMA